ncbi:MAG: hypothetical protein ABSG69_16765, partial [Candidatus Acidiferrum sp.]
NSYEGSHSGKPYGSREGSRSGPRGGYDRNRRNDSRRSSSFGASARSNFSIHADPNARPSIVRLPGEVLQAQAENQ